MNATPPRHAPMRQFAVEHDCLVVGGVPLPRLAARVGRTPFYAYDRSAITRRVTELHSTLPAGVKLHYAMKANPMPAVVAHVAQRVDGIDVASGREMQIALDAGVPAQTISIAGPGKSDTELAQAVAAGILINVESAGEVERLAEITRRTEWPARVAIRVNPDFELKSSGMKMGGGAKPFGIDTEAVPALLQRLNGPHFRFEGFHLYAGSQNLSPDAICEAQRRCYELAVELAAAAPAPVRILNLGGGFGIPYFPGEKPLDLQPIGENLARLAARAKDELPDAQIVIELGRYLVGEAGVYVCRVVDRKVSRGEVFLVTDGGLHHHLAASGNFGQVIRKNYPVAVGNRMGTGAREVASVVGPLCTPLDILADRMELAVAQLGDLIVVFQSGAYGLSASPHAFLSHPPPLETLV